MKEIVASNVNENLFKFTDAVITHNMKETFKLLKDFLSVKIDVAQLTNLLLREFRLLLYYKILEKKQFTGKKKIFLCYLFSIFSLTLLEEIGGLLTFALFHKNYWDYSSIPFSIGPYINVFISLIWGFLAMIIQYIIFPKITFLFKKTPKWLTIFLFLLFILDNYFCLKRNHIFILTFIRLTR